MKELIVSSVIITVIIFTCEAQAKIQEKKGTMRIELIRQKSPREQYMNAPNLKAFGIDYGFLDDYGMNRTNDSIALYRYLDNEFYGKIVIGHPGQIMNVAFDTAWSLTWVLSKKCQTYTTYGCWFHNLYNHDRSSYYKKDGKPYVGDEGIFNFTGFYSYENISMAHSNVTAFSFVEMVGVPSSMAFSKADGVLGLGLKDGDYEPFFYALYRQKKIRDPIFSIYLNRDRQSNKGGNIMLGFYDPKHVHQTSYPNGSVIPDTIKFLQVDAGADWQFSLDSILITMDQKKTLTLCPNGCKAISDTSSNQIIGPVEDINKINDLLNAKKIFGRWTVECDTIMKLPKIDFVLGGQNFRLEGPQYTTKMSYMGITVCFSAFVPTTASSTEGLWVLGGAFLSQYYSIYNIEDKTIGFVRAA
ncbi:unnamed protein product [Phaedon cochleariae]|uniref:Peptidase A1 domain-containing protein n=1 Tax=Phaedon cochleariae TaxID=80249 RepID=A0A9P0GT35_PHACE|nr:unnamed protein product [Phaedon cochleariae]